MEHKTLRLMYSTAWSGCGSNPTLSAIIKWGRSSTGGAAVWHTEGMRVQLPSIPLN